MEPQQNQQPAAPAQEENGVGPLVGIVIIVIVLVIGGLYFWGRQVEQQMFSEPVNNQLQPSAESDPATKNLGTQDSSTEIGSIENDLTNTNLEGLDAELNSVDQELTQ